MSKHTPGEWLREGAFVYALNEDGTNRFQASISGGFEKQGRGYNAFRDAVATTKEEVEANARLIAAAPTMLRALKVALRVIDRLGGDDSNAIMTYRTVKYAIEEAEGTE